MITQRVFSIAVAIIAAGGNVSFALAQDIGVPTQADQPISVGGGAGGAEVRTPEKMERANREVPEFIGQVPPRPGPTEEDYWEKKAQADAMRAESRNEARERFEEKRQELQRHRDEMRQQLETRRDELRERWEARKAKLSEMRKQIIKNHIERIIKRMKATVDRLTRLADKVDERIGIIASDGADVSNATSLMTDARGAIARAQTELNEATAGLRAAPETDNPAEGIGNARARFENVKAALREAHAALVEVIKSLKGRSATAPNAQDADEEPAVNE